MRRDSWVCTALPFWAFILWFVETLGVDLMSTWWVCQHARFWSSNSWPPPISNEMLVNPHLGSPWFHVLECRSHCNDCCRFNLTLGSFWRCLIRIHFATKSKIIAEKPGDRHSDASSFQRKETKSKEILTRWSENEYIIMSMLKSCKCEGFWAWSKVSTILPF